MNRADLIRSIANHINSPSNRIEAAKPTARQKRKDLEQFLAETMASSKNSKKNNRRPTPSSPANERSSKEKFAEENNEGDNDKRKSKQKPRREKSAAQWIENLSEFFSAKADRANDAAEERIVAEYLKNARPFRA